ALDVTQESHRLKAQLVGNDNALVEAKYQNTFVRPVVGARFELPGGAATLAGKTPQTKHFKGSQASAGGPQARDPGAVDYEPLSVAAGARGVWRGASLGFEVRHLAWSAGRGVVRSAIYDDKPRADLRDTDEYNVSAGYQLAAAAAPVSLTAGMAWQPT